MKHVFFRLFCLVESAMPLTPEEVDKLSDMWANAYTSTHEKYSKVIDNARANTSGRWVGCSHSMQPFYVPLLLFKNKGSRLLY